MAVANTLAYRNTGVKSLIAKAPGEKLVELFFDLSIERFKSRKTA
jgi:hypothetical protein